ncbi:bifunctional hydroxymethylpyrimidine kinase/phosphomethylpyrimidine kinase [Tenuifilum thalassicum]|nr:hydroxymethylpyrimidine/phosphomethylpyrimidine kinase [Tenuifilum thalassicum]
MVHICCIAAHDTSNGAGITHDCIVAHDFGIMAHPVITAITTQSFYNVEKIEPIYPEIVKMQLESIFRNFPIAAIKIGMLYDPETIKAVAGTISQHPDAITIVDPIIKSSGGENLLARKGYNTLKEELLPLANIITPNRNELEQLSEMAINSIDDALKAAQVISSQYKCNVLVKGGHFDGTILEDFLIGNNLKTSVTHERRNYRYNHGSGCTLSTALTCALALGYNNQEALRHAVNYTTKYFDSMNISMFE